LASLYRFFDDPPVPLAEIKPVHVRQHLTWRVDETRKRMLEQNELRVKTGRAPLAVQAEPGKVRANREKALLSHIWNFSREKGFNDLPNPCQGIKGHRETGRAPTWTTRPTRRSGRSQTGRRVTRWTWPT
jgi:hypothetical protein